MTKHVPDGRRDAPQSGEERRQFGSYVRGIALALLLTVVPFALVYWNAVSRFAMVIIIGVFALIQMIVHFRFFLHIRYARQKREDLQLLLFSALLLAIMVGGTIWIMASLASRMSMPMQP